MVGRNSPSCRPHEVPGHSTELAASRISFVVAAGWEIIGTWDDFTFSIVACARCAMNICVAGGIA